jgi:hypothetical protein
MRRMAPLGFGCVPAIGDKVTLRVQITRAMRVDRMLVVNGTALELRVDGIVIPELGAGAVLSPGQLIELDVRPELRNSPLELELERWKLGRTLLWLLQRPIKLVCAAAKCWVFK